jgi:hypothetical protein
MRKRSLDRKPKVCTWISCKSIDVHDAECCIFEDVQAGRVRKTIVDIQFQIRPIVIGCSIEKMLNQGCNAMYYRYIGIILKLIKLLQGELDCLLLEHRH